MKTTVEHHGIRWWMDKGVMCPDCGRTNDLKFSTDSSGLANSEVQSERRPYSGVYRTKHTTWFRCGSCGCFFKAEEYDE